VSGLEHHAPLGQEMKRERPGLGTGN